MYRISGDCPECGHWLVTRRNRAEGNMFVGCGAYPECRFTTQYDAALDDIQHQIEMLQSQVDDLRRGGGGSVDSDSLTDNDLKQMIFFAHPDRWPDNPLAHELVCKLNTIRSRRK
jgi:ssDNA-binding Zn-finger/Zn-ribbon topoisomerase 1